MIVATGTAGAATPGATGATAGESAVNLPVIEEIHDLNNKRKRARVSIEEQVAVLDNIHELLVKQMNELVSIAFRA
jgi:hypothetical protein